MLEFELILCFKFKLFFKSPSCIINICFPRGDDLYASIPKVIEKYLNIESSSKMYFNKRKILIMLVRYIKPISL